MVSGWRSGPLVAYSSAPTSFAADRVVVPVVRATIRRIIRQDVAIMENMTRTERLFPGRRINSVRADTPSIWLGRAAEEYRKNGPKPATDGEPAAISVTYRL